MHSDQPSGVPGDPAAKPISAPPVPTRRQHALGVSLVLGVACIWVVSAELIKYIFDDSFDAPFFLTYYSISLFSVFLIGFFRSSWRAAFEPHNPYQTVTHTSAAVPASGDRPQRAPAHRALRLAAVLCPLFFLADWTFNVGLDNTSVASSSTIATLTTLFTLVLGALAGVERFSFVKLLAIGLIIGGVALISENDERSGGREHLNGDLICILSAAIYSCYTVVLKKQSGPDGEMNVMMMMAFMGLFTAITVWPGFFIVHFADWEPFHAPSWPSIAMLTANGLIGTVLADFLWAKGVVLTTPLIGTLALSLSVPLSIIADLIMQRERFGWIYLVGACLVFVGFITVNMDEASVRQRSANEEHLVAFEDDEEDGIRLQETAAG